MCTNRLFAFWIVGFLQLSLAIEQQAIAAEPRTFATRVPFRAEGNERVAAIAVSAADEILQPPNPSKVPEEIGAGQPEDRPVARPYEFDGSSCCSGCAPCCSPCCCCSPPMWTMRVGGIFLQREHRQDDLRMGTGSGYEIDAIRRIGCTCSAVEARYFGIYGYSGKVDLGDATISLPFTQQSQLQSAELNIRRTTASWLQLLAGFRWIELDDTFDLASFANAKTFNRLFGAQVGADVSVWQYNRLSVDAIGKAGIYGNAIDGKLNAPGLFNLSTSSGHTAFVGEVGLTTRYAITNNLALRATYELLWLDGVAGVSELALNPSLTALVPNTNTIFYQGAFVGFECRH